MFCSLVAVVYSGFQETVVAMRSLTGSASAGKWVTERNRDRLRGETEMGVGNRPQVCTYRQSPQAMGVKWQDRLLQQDFNICLVLNSYFVVLKFKMFCYSFNFIIRYTILKITSAHLWFVC